MAARQGRPRDAGLPRGRERLHPGAHRAPRGPPPAGVRRDQGPHPRDRPLRAQPDPRPLVLLPVLRGQGVRRQLPRPRHRPGRLDSPDARRGLRGRRAGPARRAGAARPQRAGRGPRLLLPRRVVGEPRREAGRLRHRRGRRRAVHDPGQGPRHRRAPRRRDHRDARRGDVGPQRRPLLLRDRRRVLASRTRSGGTASAPTATRTSWSTTSPTAATGWASAGAAPTAS